MPPSCGAPTPTPRFAASIRAPRGARLVSSPSTPARTSRTKSFPSPAPGTSPTAPSRHHPHVHLNTPPHPLLSDQTVRYLGDGVAMVVAETRAAARDALDLIEVDYDPLPATVDPEASAKKGAPQLHADVPRNIAFTWKV